MHERWTTTRALAELRKLGCKCDEIANTGPKIKLADGTSVGLRAGISQDSTETIGQPRSYKCRHTCSGCGASVLEEADPTFDWREMYKDEDLN